MAALVDGHIAQAGRLATALRGAGFDVVNRVVLNQVLVRGATDAQTAAIRLAVEESGEAWFGGTMWEGRPAFRISISSWRTRDDDIDALVALLVRCRDQAA